MNGELYNFARKRKNLEFREETGLPGLAYIREIAVSVVPAQRRSAPPLQMSPVGSCIHPPSFHCEKDLGDGKEALTAPSSLAGASNMAKMADSACLLLLLLLHSTAAVSHPRDYRAPKRCLSQGFTEWRH